MPDVFLFYCQLPVPGKPSFSKSFYRTYSFQICYLVIMATEGRNMKERTAWWDTTPCHHGNFIDPAGTLEIVDLK
jgi:hypothetical protein